MCQPTEKVQSEKRDSKEETDEEEVKSSRRGIQGEEGESSKRR